MLEGFRQSWVDSFRADKILFPSRIKRIGLYALQAFGVLVVVAGFFLLMDVGGEKGVIVFLLMAVLSLYLASLSMVMWSKKATQYIVKKEA